MEVMYCLSCRALNVMITWIKYVLTSEQKKTDFKPESEDCPMQMFSAVRNGKSDYCELLLK